MAQSNPPLSILPGGGPQTVDDVFEKFNRIVGYFFIGIIIIASLYILYAAYLYLTSEGSDDKVESARKALTYAIVGVVVAFSVRAIMAIVKSFLGTN